MNQGAYTPAAEPLDRSSQRKDRKGAPLVMLLAPEPVTLAAFANTQGPIAQVTSKIYEGLVDFDEGLRPVPCLAESWAMDASACTFTFRLRRDVRFHDGAAFTSRDVRCTFLDVLRLVHPRGRQTFAHLNDIETPDDHTAVFRFAQPVPHLLVCLSSLESPVLPSHLIHGSLTRYQLAEQPIGTGPFRFVQWTRGTSLVLERVPSHWKSGSSDIRRLEVRIVDGYDEASRLLVDGEAHVCGMGTLPSSSIARLTGAPQLAFGPGAAELLAPVMQLDFNTRRPPFDRQDVRRAIASLLDGRNFVDSVFHGRGTAMQGPMHDSWIRRGLVDRGTVAATDKMDAVRLLKRVAHEAAPSGHGLHFTLDVIPYGEEWSKAGDVVRTVLGEIGIDVTLREESFDAWLGRIYRQHEFSATINYVYLQADPALGVKRFYHSQNAHDTPVFTNASGWHSVRTDRLLERAECEPDPALRSSIYRKLAQELMVAQPAAWLVQVQPVSCCNTSFENVLVSPLDVYGSFGSSQWGTTRVRPTD